MAARGQNFLRRSLQVHEILSALECEEYDDYTKNIIYVEPPIEHADQVTDEDSDKSDEEHGANLNHLGRRLLQIICELQRFRGDTIASIPSTSTAFGSNTQRSSNDNSLSSSDSEDEQPLSNFISHKLSRSAPPAKKKKSTHLVANLRTRMRIKKWWWPIFAYLVDVSVVNAWLLARKNGCTRDTESLFVFRRFIARSLLSTHGIPPHQGRKPAKPICTMRYDGKGHWLVPINTERQCANQCGGKSKFQCQKCDVGLHPKCHMAYHVVN